MSAGETRPSEVAQICIVCGSHNLRSLPRYTSAHLVRCRQCGLTFAGRWPSDDELNSHYRGYGTSWFDSPVTRVRYAELLETFEPYRRLNRILDFGCGAGYLLEAAAAKGWDAHGVEFGELAIELSRARQLQVLAAPLAPHALPAGHFDVITAIEVVEHLRDPMDEIATIVRLLRPGGLFYCTTPNFNSASRRLLGARWWNIDYPEHLSYFTTGSLRGWLRRAGLVPVSVETTGFSLTVMRRSLGPPPINAAPGQTADERLRVAIQGSPALRTAKVAADQVLNTLHAGDTIKGRFERSPSGTDHL